MIDSKKVTIYLTEEEDGILSAISKRLNISKSMVMRHLLIYQGMCGGDMPITRKILALAPDQRSVALKSILRRAQTNSPEFPQKWSCMVKDALGSDDHLSQDRGAESIVRRLLEGDQTDNRDSGGQQRPAA